MGGPRCRAERFPWSVCCLCLLEPAGIFLVCFMKGCPSLRILTQGRFLLQSGWPPSDQYCSRPFFCFVLLSWINRERLIHFSRKTGCTKILQVTMKQTCSRTIIFIKGPNNMCSRHLHGVATPHHPPALGPRPSCLFLWVSVSSDVKLGPTPPTSCPLWGADEHTAPRTRGSSPSRAAVAPHPACEGLTQVGAVHAVI